MRLYGDSPGADCVISGGTDAANVDRNAAAVARGPLMLHVRCAVAASWKAAGGPHWQGLV